MKWESLRNSLQTYIQSIEQFDSTAPKNLNQNLFIILLLKITITHWLMHAVTMKWESLRNSLQTYIQSIEQFDSTAPKNLNQNLFIILLLKITITHWLMHAVTMKWESLRNSLQTYIQSIEQFDSTAPKNLNQNLFIILLLKITIIHWLMHAVAMKWESLHRKNYFWRFNFLVGAKSTFYSSNECYVHCWNIIYTVFQWNVLALKWIECFSVRDSWDHKRSGTVYTLVYRSGPQPS